MNSPSENQPFIQVEPSGSLRANRMLALAFCALALVVAASLGALQSERAFAAELASANLQTADAAESVAANPDSVGDYLLGYKLCKTGTTNPSHVDGIFDAHVKLAVTEVADSKGEGEFKASISLLVPTSAKAYSATVVDVLKDVAIRTGEGAYVSAIRTETSEGVLFSDLPVSDISAMQELAFGLEGTVCHSNATDGDYATYMKADLVFTGMTSWWPGFAAQAPTGLADGTYVMDIETKTGGNVDASTNTTSFTMPIMGGNVFGSKMWLTVLGGKYTATLRAEAVSNSYVRNIRVYTRAGNYTLDADPDSSLVDVKTLSYQRNDDGSLYADEDAARYSDALSFNLASKGSGYWTFLRFFITSRAPVSSMIEKTPFVVLMKWDTLRPASAPDTAALDKQLASAKQLDEADYEEAGWAVFKNRRDAAQDALRASAVLGQGDVDGACDKLAAAQKALVKKAPASDSEKPAADKAGEGDAAKKATADKAAKEKAAKEQAEKAAKEKASKDAAAKKAAAEKAAKKKATPGRPKLTAKTKSAKKGRVTVAWKKVAKAKGYQVKVGKKTYLVKSAKTLKKTVKAAAGKKVKVKVRAFGKYKGKAVYGPWSKAKTVKVKKK